MGGALSVRRHHRWPTDHIVSIVDEHTRKCLRGMVERSITSEHLITELDRPAAERGCYPTVLRCNNGPESACSAIAD
jgi:hypothetical protein